MRACVVRGWVRARGQERGLVFVVGNIDVAVVAGGFLFVFVCEWIIAC